MGIVSYTTWWLQQRPVENRLMLQQLLATIRARFLLLPRPNGDPRAKAAFDELNAIIDRFSAWQREQRRTSPERSSWWRSIRSGWKRGKARAAGGNAPPPAPGGGAQPPGAEEPTLPSWDEAALAEQLLAGLTPQDELPGEIAQALNQLEPYDAALHAKLESQWALMKSATPANGRLVFDEAQARGLLLSALRRCQWKRNEQYLIRKLSTVYACRHTLAFAVVLAMGVGVTLLELRAPPQHFEGVLSGLALAVAAGLLGASFSSLTRRSAIEALDNLEQARAATGWPMLLLRLGVGVGAAIVLYFLFETGLMTGQVFPELEKIGFGAIMLEEPGEATDYARRLADTMGALETLRSDLSSIMNGGADAEATREALGEIDAALAQAVESERLNWRVLGDFVPNPDLSKLFVWSFAAGFFEKLVPNILADARAHARAPS